MKLFLGRSITKIENFQNFMLKLNISLSWTKQSRCSKLKFLVFNMLAQLMYISSSRLLYAVVCISSLKAYWVLSFVL